MAITNEALVEWFNKQSTWIKDAVNTYYSNGEFTDKDIKRFATECIDEAAGKKKRIKVAASNLLSRDDGKSFALKSIGNIEGVNALASGKKLDFGENGVTVVYGDNGAGKSGYIRILKKIADAKYKEDLKDNIYKASTTGQSCEVSVICEGLETVFDCDLKKNEQEALFKNIDIFDTKISSAYISDANEAAYEPWIFSLFGELANSAALVRNEIDRQKSTLGSFDITFPEDFEKTEAGKKVSNINADSSFDEDFFVWTKENDEALSNKKKEANIENIKNRIDKLDKEIIQLSAIRDYFQKFVSFFSVESINSILNSRDKWNEAENELKAAEIVFSESASDLDKESISNSAWRALWQNTKEYYESFLREKGIIRYTDNNGMCPLCGQKINDADRVHRMKSIDEYINGSISQKATEKKKEYFDSLRKCPKPWEREQIQIAIDSCEIGGCKDIVLGCSDLIIEASDQIHSGEIEMFEPKTIDVASVIEAVNSVITEKDKIKTTTETLLQSEDYKAVIDEIKSLEAQKYVSGIKDKVTNRIEHLKKIRMYDEALKLTVTNKLTTKSKELGQELIAGDYMKRFNDELKLLTKGTVKASLKPQRASRGKTPFKIVLDGVHDDRINPEDVFSEGEKRVVSLAAFFAESSGRKMECPLVVDDPISSLDVRYEERVIDRLINAAKHRQVIVFTHRLSMVVGLYDGCGKEVPFDERELLGRGKNKGVPSISSFNGGKSLGKLKKLKTENISKLKKLDENEEEYIRGIHYVCQEIRNHTEKSVEDALLFGVVKRYRRSIQTLNKISWLSCITPDDCRLVDDMMTKYSCYDHSQSDETPLQEFPLDEIETDLDRLIAWLEDIKKRQNEL